MPQTHTACHVTHHCHLTMLGEIIPDVKGEGMKGRDTCECEQRVSYIVRRYAIDLSRPVVCDLLPTPLPRMFKHWSQITQLWGLYYCYFYQLYQLILDHMVKINVFIFSGLHSTVCNPELSLRLRRFVYILPLFTRPFKRNYLHLSIVVHFTAPVFDIRRQTIHKLRMVILHNTINVNIGDCKICIVILLSIYLSIPGLHPP